MEREITDNMAAGKKYDVGKMRFDLLPYDALWEVARVYTIGATKYDDRNWEGGIKYGRVIAALFRHLIKWIGGEKYDPEDHQHHLSSVIWNGLTLLHYDLNPTKYAQFDDRPKDHVDVWNQKLNSNEAEAVQLTLPLEGIGSSTMVDGSH